MQLRLSVLARNRTFAKAMRRVRIKLQPLIDAFEDIVLEHPIHEAILVGITDGQPAEFFEQVENNDGFFQVLAGCSVSSDDDELAENLFAILRKAMRACPFATPDYQAFEALFERLRPRVLRT